MLCNLNSGRGIRIKQRTKLDLVVDPTLQWSPTCKHSLRSRNTSVSKQFQSVKFFYRHISPLYELINTLANLTSHKQLDLVVKSNFYSLKNIQIFLHLLHVDCILISSAQYQMVWFSTYQDFVFRAYLKNIVKGNTLKISHDVNKYQSC